MFEVGDEIRLALPQKKFMYAVVTNVDEANSWITAFLDNGRNTCFKIGYAKWEKTGNHFPEIVSVLSQLGKEKEVTL